MNATDHSAFAQISKGLETATGFRRDNLFKVAERLRNPKPSASPFVLLLRAARLDKSWSDWCARRGSFSDWSKKMGLRESINPRFPFGDTEYYDPGSYYNPPYEAKAQAEKLLELLTTTETCEYSGAWYADMRRCRGYWKQAVKYGKRLSKASLRRFEEEGCGVRVNDWMVLSGCKVVIHEGEYFVVSRHPYYGAGWTTRMGDGSEVVLYKSATPIRLEIVHGGTVESHAYGYIRNN